MSNFLGPPWTINRQAPLSMGFSRQEYWSGLPFPPLGDFPDPGFEPTSPTMQADFTVWVTKEALGCRGIYTNKQKAAQA